MLKSLTLHRFRHVEPETVLRFTEGFNVLLGRNGTGKTTLLDLISMVLRSDFSALKEEEFDIEYEYTHEHGSGVVRFENNLKLPPTESTRTRVAWGASKPRRHQPHVHVALRRERLSENQGFEIDVADGATRWRGEGAAWEGPVTVDVFEGALLDTLSEGIPYSDRAGLEARIILDEFNRYGEWSYRFDESLDVFDSITTRAAERTRKPGRPPAIALGARFDHTHDPHGKILVGPTTRRVFVPSLYEPAEPNPGQVSTSVDISSRSALGKFPALAGIRGMSMSFAVAGTWEEEPKGLWWGLNRAEFLFSGAGAVVFNQDRLSFGQKRLLAFLYYLDANPHFVVADELVNGMHHDWIRACLDEIGERQAFLTSQNPLLLDYLPLESVEQVERTFIQCRSEVVDEKPLVRWSNLTRSDAEELFADYKVGIQPLGEILRARGLW